jgi:serine/threonine-protein kinase
MDRLDALPILEGEVIAEKYRVERLLGEGAMGRVFQARHLLLGHSVALKLLRASVDNDDLRTRFVREAKATMALRSDHIVRVFDLGVLPSNTPYMVLEYLEGTDLRSVLETRGALPVEEAVDYVLQVCEALSEAHLNGIVHRDLKPQNLFLTRRANGTPCLKLLDFGVSKFDAKPDGNDELTHSQVLLGSPVYMSPEQIRDSRKVDARADVWSLGVVLYMLLGGGRPFEGEGLAGTCAAIMVDPPRPLSSRCPGVPLALEAVVFACLEKSRERRTQDVAEVAKRLEPLASAAGRVSAERVIHVFAASPPRAHQAYAPAEENLPSSDRAAKREAQEPTAVDGTAVDPSSRALIPIDEEKTNDLRVRRRKTPLVAAFALLALVAVGGFTWLRAVEARRSPPQPSPIAAAPPVEKDEHDKDPKEPPPKGESVEPGAPHAAAATSALATAPTPAARRPSGARSPASRPAATGSAKRKDQVDRNGVPILD